MTESERIEQGVDDITKGKKTRNEVRIELGLKPLPGCDELTRNITQEEFLKTQSDN